MSVQPGNYRIQNVGAHTYMDMFSGWSAQGTRIAGWWDNDNLNQLWQFEPVGNDTWKLLNAASGTYALAPIHALNKGLVGGTPPDLFTFIDSDGSYQIKLADEPLVLYLANGLDDTQVTLQAADGGDDNQFWYLHPATN
ncbi:predicted protein [Postia placenta Mad-698-R]|uniref:Carbohydrate-binding module family 13 protein n=1 Tax=Postia placenta MAD-698-R-SB12 TaxID=670580 RepID=A0A1X6NHH8_9APHY|nr:carbohydrate-binding module family 13 protein [Postia placenta MAD-698-R-SB12]EED84786.1 predicted protein [Postia placenta Mad-698-R]OSX68071.1 carbohydrate-binding module family 13 protein [Postia placenta MAD-698-R-SB12]